MRYLLYLLMTVVLSSTVYARNLVTNGDFNSGAANWTTACTSVEAIYFETTYGGTVATNHVAEIDDESCFYQDVCVLPGASYVLSLNASRRVGAGATLTTHLQVDGLNAANTVVGSPLASMDFTRTNTTFGFTPVTGIPVIAVPAGSGIVRLRITFTDNTPGYATLGMIIDDVSLLFQTPPAFSGDTITCINTSTPLALVNVPAAGVAYSWALNGATPASSSLASPSATWAAAGSYVVSCALGNGTCPVDTVSINMQVGTVAQPTVVSPVGYCTGQAASPLTATGTNLRWYTTATGGTPLPAAPTPSTTTPGTTTWYVSQVSGICESSRAAITVNVSQGVTAAFSYTIRYGCERDTVIFTNQSTGGGNYQWSFGDNTAGSNQVSPQHIYTTQNNFTVRLLSTNGGCVDSSVVQIDLRHPLTASFTASSDTICQHQTVSFTNTSTTTTRNNIAPTYFWDFGDGDTSTLEHPLHTFATTGIFRVILRVTDFVPCQDSAVLYIYVDTASGLSFTVSDTVLCEGQGIVLEAQYAPIGFRQLTWNLGDAPAVYTGNPINHAYDTSGIFTITVTADYRVCPDTTLTKQIVIRPYPRLNLGPDTFLCPGAAPLSLLDGLNAGNPSASWKWNTGAVTSGIVVREPGTYAATVRIDGCTTTDSITVSKDCYMDIPNSFTPNDDGLNDYFFPRTLLAHSVAQFRMQVFNRWGQIIFETQQPDGRGWDGRFNNAAQPQGVYIYLIDVLFGNGIKEHYTGNVTLLR